MVEADDLNEAGSVLQNKLGLTDQQTLATAITEHTTRRLAELRSSPVRGGFDSSHLQEIHRYLYQDVFDWAGELRRIEKGGTPDSSLEDSLNRAFDRLSRENLLRGLDKNTWMRRASEHIEELRTLRPFPAGNDLVIQEFVTELAHKNNLRLEWQQEPESSIGAINFAIQAERSSQLRRLILLAVDADPVAPIIHRHRSFDLKNELSLSNRWPHA